MDCRNPEKMDDELEALLRSEPLQSVPAGFGRKVKARVTLAALLDRERQQHRTMRAVLGTMGFVVLGFLMLPALFPRAVELVVEHFIPGGAGYLDYLVNITRYGYSGGDLLMLVAGVSAVLAVGLAAVPRNTPQRKSEDSRSWSPMGRS